jgi:hypothetical protein
MLLPRRKGKHTNYHEIRTKANATNASDHNKCLKTQLTDGGHVLRSRICDLEMEWPRGKKRIIKTLYKMQESKQGIYYIQQ